MTEVGWTLLPKPSHMPMFSFPFQTFAYLVALVPLLSYLSCSSCAASTSGPSKAFHALKTTPTENFLWLARYG
jgi:hypothetical protein